MALIQKEKEILKVMLNASKKQKLNEWENNQKELIKAIREIPNFSMSFELNLNSSYFSLIKNITPKDKFKICKKDSDIKIEMEISSLNTALREFKGKNVFLIQQEIIKNEERLKVTKYDWNKKIVRKILIFCSLGEPS